MVRCLARENGSTSEAHLQYLSGVNVLNLKVQLIRSYRSADRGLCIPALVEGNRTVLVSAYGPSRRVPLVRCVAQKPLNAWME